MLRLVNRAWHSPADSVFLTDLYGTFLSLPHIIPCSGLHGQSSCALWKRHPHARGVANARLIGSNVLRSILMNKQFFIFTDGSAIGNPGPAGLGSYRAPRDKAAGDRRISSVVNRL